MNLEGVDVVRALALSDAPHAAAWDGLEVTVVAGAARSADGGRGAKGLPRGVIAADGRLCIVDDNRDVWRPDLQRYVVKSPPFFVNREINTKADLEREKAYLARLRDDFVRALDLRGDVAIGAVSGRSTPPPPL